MANGTKIVLIIEYEGTCYNGFQFQDNAPTVQEEIETALYKLNGEKVRIIPASRTDTGVHALGQVVSFRQDNVLPLAAYVKGLNHFLPDDIAVKAAYRVDDAFDVRRQAVSREYRYTILNRADRSPLERRFTYLHPGKLDVEAMNLACQELVGKHDLSSFATRMEIGRRGTVKNVYRASVTKDGDRIVFSILANSYLPHQVRNTVGALIQVGTGKMTVDGFRELIEARQPGLAGPTAPPQGLRLMQVNYRVPLEN